MGGLDEELLALEEAAAGPGRRKMPKPPPDSALANWPEPSEHDIHTMQRYREQFLKENLLWLQHTFADLLDQRTMAQYRQTLLNSLTALLGEVPPESYHPHALPPKVIGGEVVERAPNDVSGPSGLEFDADPPQQLAVEYVQEQNYTYENSEVQTFVRLWLQRARFLLFLNRVTSMYKPDSQAHVRKEHCELCSRTTGLTICPIYTLTHLASQFRTQRDMSPIWNTPLWIHYYRTFTPTCVLCQQCYDYYYMRNLNVPIDERRYQRLRQVERTPLDVLGQSHYHSVPLDALQARVAKLWLEWGRRLARGEKPEDFLPYEGYFDERSSESSASSEVPKSQASSESGEPYEEEKALPNVPIPWGQRAVMMYWLRRAKQNLDQPEFRRWTDHVNQGSRREMDVYSRVRGFRLDMHYISSQTIQDRLGRPQAKRQASPRPGR